MRMLGDLLNSKHKSDYYLKAEIIKKVFAVTILLLTMMSGPKAMCYGLIVYSLLDIFSATIFTKRILPEVTFMKILISVLPILMQSLLMGVCVYFCISVIESLWWKLVIGIVIGIGVYVILSFKMNKNIMHYLMSLLPRK